MGVKARAKAKERVRARARVKERVMERARVRVRVETVASALALMTLWRCLSKNMKLKSVYSKLLDGLIMRAMLTKLSLILTLLPCLLEYKLVLTRMRSTCVYRK